MTKKKATASKVKDYVIVYKGSKKVKKKLEKKQSTGSRGSSNEPSKAN